MIDHEIYRYQVQQGLAERRELLPEMQQPPAKVAERVSEGIREVRARIGHITLDQKNHWGISLHLVERGVAFGGPNQGGLPDDLRVWTHDDSRLFETQRRNPFTGVIETASMDPSGLWVYEENRYAITEGQVDRMVDLDSSRGSSMLYAANAMLQVTNMVRMVPS